jgi:hypothetical protein
MRILFLSKYLIFLPIFMARQIKLLLKLTLLLISVYAIAKHIIYKLNEHYEKQSFTVPLPLIITEEIPSSGLLNKCEPIYRDKTQYQVEIDGEIYPKYVPNYFNQSLNFICLNSGRMKKILLWTTYFGSPHFYFGLGKRDPFVVNECPVTNCELTNDRSVVNQSNLVIVHMMDNVAELPRTRPANQRWV